MKSFELVNIGFKEKRNLCEYHYKLFLNKDEKHKVNFTKASKFK